MRDFYLQRYSALLLVLDSSLRILVVYVTNDLLSIWSLLHNVKLISEFILSIRSRSRNARQKGKVRQSIGNISTVSIKSPVENQEREISLFSDERAAVQRRGHAAEGPHTHRARPPPGASLPAALTLHQVTE